MDVVSCSPFTPGLLYCCQKKCLVNSNCDHRSSSHAFYILFSCDRPIVQGITRWLPATPAEAKALSHEEASALVIHAIIEN